MNERKNENCSCGEWSYIHNQPSPHEVASGARSVHATKAQTRARSHVRPAVHSTHSTQFSPTPLSYENGGTELRALLYNVRECHSNTKKHI